MQKKTNRWLETAEIIKERKKTRKKPKGPSPLMSRLDSLEKLLKDKR